MDLQADSHLWLLSYPVGDGVPDLLQREPAGAALDGLWQAVDAPLRRAYAVCPARPGPSWQQLQPVKELAGASVGADAPFHYVVETNVLPEHQHLLDDWYAQEHLPGLAAVPGTVRAGRYRRLDGTPTSYACYDLAALAVMGSPPWLAVRHTDWSSRVRPLFRDTVRTAFRRMA